jgi:hypothetical protein
MQLDKDLPQYLSLLSRLVQDWLPLLLALLVSLLEGKPVTYDDIVDTGFCLLLNLKWPLCRKCQQKVVHKTNVAQQNDLDMSPAGFSFSGYNNNNTTSNSLVELSERAILDDLVHLK